MGSIRNYSSGKSPAETAGKIQQLLAQNGARRAQIEYDGDGEPLAVNFQMEVKGELLWFRLEPNAEGMQEALKEADDITRSEYQTEEQARRTAWKNKLEWLEIQFSMVESNQAEVEELLLGMGVTNNGETVFERIQRDQKFLKSSF